MAKETKIPDATRKAAHEALELWLDSCVRTTPDFEDGEEATIKFVGGFSTEANTRNAQRADELDRYFNLSIESSTIVNV